MIKQLVLTVLFTVLLFPSVGNAQTKTKLVELDSLNVKVFSTKVEYSFGVAYDSLTEDLVKWLLANKRVNFLKQIVQVDGRDLKEVFRGQSFFDYKDPRINVRGTSVTLIVVYKE